MTASKQPPASAYQGLAIRLEGLNQHVSSRDEKNQGLDETKQRLLIEQRNEWLRDYRARALGVPAEYLEEKPPAKPYTTRVFSYIHGEFGFNAPRPIGRTTRVTHLVFSPIFVEKIAEEAQSAKTPLQRVMARLRPRQEPDTAVPRNDPAQVIGPVTDAALNWLWRQAIHGADPSRKTADTPERGSQAAGRRQAPQPSFRGAQDRYFFESKELFDYSEPYITQKSSIVARRALLLARDLAKEAPPQTALFAGVENTARQKSEEIQRCLFAAGMSHRLANTVEYLWKHYQAAAPSPDGDLAQEIAHFRWTRHDRPYQTFTFTHETPDFAGMSFDATGEDPFCTTALHAFPGDFFDDGRTTDGKHEFPGVFGRFMQGANWLVVPVEKFFSVPIRPDRETFLQALRRITDDHDLFRKSIRNLGRKLRGRTNAGVSAEDIRAIFDRANLDVTMAAGIDRIVIDAVRPFLNKCFHNDPERSESEIVGVKCMDGRGYIFANIRHDADEDGDPRQGIFTRAVIVDCGMHKFQRGRLMQSMTEFATERTMALRWIARFRLLHSALSVVEAKLNQAVSNYHNDRSQFSPLDDENFSVVPYEYWRGPHEADTRGIDEGTKLHPAAKERQLIIALEFLSSCLSLMNDIVEGGMMDRASGTTGSVASLKEKLKAIRETPIIGHQSLTDFLERRFIPATRVISRASDRYQLLRTRISKVAELMNATLSAKEWHENQRQVRRQIRLMTVAEIVGAVAVGYYGSKLLTEYLDALCRDGRSLWGRLSLLLPCGATETNFFIFASALSIVTGLCFYSLVHVVREKLSERPRAESGKARSNKLLF